MLSILTPAFNEAENLPALYARLVEAMGTVGGEWEVGGRGRSLAG